jgi:hypothetical protein
MEMLEFFPVVQPLPHLPAQEISAKCIVSPLFLFSLISRVVFQEMEESNIAGLL